MKSLLLSHKETDYASVVWQQSRCLERVSFAVRRPSLAQRIELTSRVRELTRETRLSEGRRCFRSD